MYYSDDVLSLCSKINCVHHVCALKDEMSRVQGFGWADIWEQWDGSSESDCKKNTFENLSI